jgi:tetratricopeptide (TPR) repeat protein
MSDAFPRFGAATRAAALACAGMLAACATTRARREAGPAALLTRAQRDLTDGRAREAQRQFEEALEQEPTLYPAIRGRIEAALRAGALQKVADEALARTQARGGDADGLAWYALGLCRFAATDRAGALAALTRAAQLLPTEAEPQFRLGLALLDGDRFAEARGPLARAVELAPLAARYRVAYATCLDRLGDRKGAVAALREVPLLQPTNEEAELAVQASRAITDPFRGVPPQARGDLERALGYLLKDAPGMAVPPLEQLVARLPTLAAAHALLGLAAVRLDDPGRAASELLRAAELSPEAPQPHVYLAELYAAKDRHEEAAGEYAAALERNPLDVVTLRKLGELRLSRLGRPGEAIEPLSRAAALVPSGDGVQLLLAAAELGAGKAPEGRARLQRLADERPEDAEVLLRLALALYDERARASPERRTELGDRVQALVDKVLSLQPGNPAASRLLRALQGE